MRISDFRQIWFVDTEFKVPPGELPEPICLVARELWSGRTLRLFAEELRGLNAPPYPTDRDALIVSYYASAELGCHLALGWPVPKYILDLFIEFRNVTNGLETPCGRGLIGALAWFGLPGLDAANKETMRGLAMRGGPYTDEERRGLLEYCEGDVLALERLYRAMIPKIDLPRALLRGRYAAAAAHMERAGVPIDVEMLGRLNTRWTEIKARLIAEVDADYRVFDGPTFKLDRFERYLEASGIPWPRLESGRLQLDDDTFKMMAEAYPVINPIREVRVKLSELRLNSLEVGSDGRNRCLLGMFGARSGRNTPSNAVFIFGPARWVRHLIKPSPGTGLAYIDWSQQEFAIAAYLSGDRCMIEAYESGDPYLAFAVQARLAPEGATKESHPHERELCKTCVLGTQYGMEENSLARRIRKPVMEARELLRLHRETYPTFWKWSNAAVDHAMLFGKIETVFGWNRWTDCRPNPRSLRNHPVQSNGAEMLRLACCLMTERGIQVDAPVHDAVLIEAPLDQLEDQIAAAQAAMAEASAAVLGGPRIRSDVRLVRHPDRFTDEKGAAMWQRVERIVEELERG